jgi:hypothetical protein
MHVRHRIAVTLLLAIAAIAGLQALTRTLDVGSSHAATGDRARASLIVRRQHLLDRVQASLHRTMKQRPPSLPRIPRYPKSTPHGGTPAGVAAQGVQQVVYVRPPPHVVRVHRAGGGEHDDHGGGGGEGGDD